MANRAGRYAPATRWTPGHREGATDGTQPGAGPWGQLRTGTCVVHQQEPGRTAREVRGQQQRRRSGGETVASSARLRPPPAHVEGVVTGRIRPRLTPFLIFSMKLKPFSPNLKCQLFKFQYSLKYLSCFVFLIGN